MTFVSGPARSELPKVSRPGAGRKIDDEASKALIEMLSASSEATATDATAYATEEEARKTANRARRLGNHTAPEGQVVRARVIEDGGTFRWVVYLAPAPKPMTPEKKAAAKAKRAATKAANAAKTK